MVNVRLRETGAIAATGKGTVVIATPTGGRMEVVTAPSAPGFSPLDLIYASLSACLVISVRTAAARQGLADRLTGVAVTVTGEKAKDEPSRVARFDILFDIQGDLTEDERHGLMELAENEICTISNTLKAAPLLMGRLAET